MFIWPFLHQLSRYFQKLQSQCLFQGRDMKKNPASHHGKVAREARWISLLFNHLIPMVERIPFWLIKYIKSCRPRFENRESTMSVSLWILYDLLTPICILTTRQATDMPSWTHAWGKPRCHPSSTCHFGNQCCVKLWQRCSRLYIYIHIINKYVRNHPCFEINAHILKWLWKMTLWLDFFPSVGNLRENKGYNQRKWWHSRTEWYWLQICITSDLCQMPQGG